MIRAIPMSAGDATKKGYRVVNDGEPWTDPWPGYEVEYDTGYKSWSPADAFEKAYDLLSEQAGTNPVHKDLLRFFAFAHLPKHLQEVSAPFTALAWRIANRCKDGRESSVALRKLLEAKDAAVRACL